MCVLFQHNIQAVVHPSLPFHKSRTDNNGSNKKKSCTVTALWGPCSLQYAAAREQTKGGHFKRSESTVQDTRGEGERGPAPTVHPLCNYSPIFHKLVFVLLLLQSQLMPPWAPRIARILWAKAALKQWLCRASGETVVGVAGRRWSYRTALINMLFLFNCNGRAQRMSVKLGFQLSELLKQITQKPGVNHV